MPLDAQTTPGGSPDVAEEALDEARAWDEVLASWQEDAVHRAYLARWPELDGLTRAGKRYRAVLAERPGDPVAQRWRDEILKRATVQGLAQLPRTAPRAPVPRWAKIAIFSASSSVLGWAAWRLFELLGKAPAP